MSGVGGSRLCKLFYSTNILPSAHVGCELRYEVTSTGEGECSVYDKQRPHDRESTRDRAHRWFSSPVQRAGSDARTHGAGSRDLDSLLTRLRPHSSRIAHN